MLGRALHPLAFLVLGLLATPLGLLLTPRTRRVALLGWAVASAGVLLLGWWALWTIGHGLFSPALWLLFAWGALPCFLVPFAVQATAPSPIE
jgi:hypothetical protein